MVILQEQASVDGTIVDRLQPTHRTGAGSGQRNLSFCLMRVAEFHERQGNQAEVLPFVEEGLKIDERLASLDPTNATWQSDVASLRALAARLRGEEASAQ